MAWISSERGDVYIITKKQKQRKSYFISINQGWAKCSRYAIDVMLIKKTCNYVNPISVASYLCIYTQKKFIKHILSPIIFLVE